MKTETESALKLKPRTTYRDGNGKEVCIAGLAKRDFEGKPVYWSIQGDHYTEEGLFVGCRRVPVDGSHVTGFETESYTLQTWFKNLVSEDTSDKAKEWWKDVAV